MTARKVWGLAWYTSLWRFFFSIELVCYSKGILAIFIIFGLIRNCIAKFNLMFALNDHDSTFMSDQVFLFILNNKVDSRINLHQRHNVYCWKPIFCWCSVIDQWLVISSIARIRFALSIRLLPVELMSSWKKALHFWSHAKKSIVGFLINKTFNEIVGRVINNNEIIES